MKALSTFLKVLLCLAILAPASAHAIYRTNSVDLGGHIRTTNIFRHPDIDEWGFIMQRNTLRLRLEYKWLQRGKAFGKWNTPWLERSDIFVLYRGVYDSIYDITPGMMDDYDLQGQFIEPQFRRLETIPKHERDELKFNNRIREAYIDLYFKNLPLTLRIGKQQVVWGESDGFRMLDRANTLDLSWHFFQELPPPGFGFDELRQPFFMVKGLWDFKQIGPLSQTFLEAYWNPGFDWNPGKIGFLPRPWGVRLLDPIENAKGTGVFQSSFCRNASGGTCDSLLNGTTLFNQGNYDKNPVENSQFGVRFHWLAGSTEWSLNYLYQRFAPDGSPVAIIRGVPEDKQVYVPEIGQYLDATTFCEGVSFNGENPDILAQIPWAKNEFCAEYFAPYVHTVGLSFNWFEGEWTQAVWRIETIIDFDLPFYNGDKQNALLGRAPNGPTLLPGISERNMWKGMLAFDRPTWIRWLNKKTTFFLSGQFFWHYIINHERRRCAIGDQPERLPDGSPNPNFIGYTADPAENCGSDTQFLLPGEQTGFVGPLDLPQLDAPAGHGRDTIHQWELLMTFAALGFYRGGTLVPALIYLLDPVNSYSQELALGMDWFYTPDLAFNITTRLIWAGAPWDPYDGHKNDSDIDNGELFEPWFLGGGSRGRSETSIQFTWQF
ncbi:MAG TPA: DUF1302 family protein [Candidatus Limnocylindrales bacterium]|nr:DUF1302 family protein [Candidatus Limnocylindrales bacterium]